MTLISATVADARGWLQQSNYRLGPNQYTYSVPGAASVWSDYPSADDEPNRPGYSAPDEALASGFRAAMAAWDSYIAPNFTEVADNAGGQGEVRIAYTTITTGALGYAYQGPQRSTPGSSIGDIWISSTEKGGSWAPGSYNYMSLLHEVGHTLGLKHSFEAPVVPAAYDTVHFTVMTYVSNAPEAAVSFTSSGNSIRSRAESPVALTPMVLDIAAVQAIYGADPTTRTGDDRYTLTPWTPSLQTIYDAGGIDTVDASAIALPSMIDLRPGSTSSIGMADAAAQIAYWSALYPQFQSFIAQTINNQGAQLYTYRDNLGIAFGTIVENAIGGAGDDTLIGNDAANRLEGGAGRDSLSGGIGDDVLVGGDGADMLDGGAGLDTADYSGSSARVSVDLLAGRGSGGTADGDTLNGIERVIGSGFGDVLGGDGTANILVGGGGDDRLTGGGGNDVLDGGAGIDTAVLGSLYHQASATVRAVTGPEGSDTLGSIERAEFRDGVLSLDENDTWAQVVRLYDTVLQRLPDVSGLDFHTQKIASGARTLFEVANDFLYSAEFQQATGGLSNADFVRYLYQTALGREADGTGLSYWTAQLDGGLPRSTMLVNFSETAEHRAQTADAVASGYFTTDASYKDAALLYDTGLGRLPDAAGILYWGEALKTGAMTLSQEAEGFAASAEFSGNTAGLSNAQLVDYMYQNTLGRAADAGGAAYWTARLDAGLSKAAILLDFALSPEHRTLLAPFIDHGIVLEG